MSNPVCTMVSYLNPERLECLTARIEEKAHDLFKVKPGKPQLHVKRVFKTRTPEGKEATGFARNRHISDVSHIKGLEDVRKLIFPIPCRNPPTFPIVIPLDYQVCFLNQYLVLYKNQIL